MSWLFSQALVAEYSAATSLDGAPSAPLSVMPTPHRFWRNDKTMEPSQLSLFGLTCAVLTEDHGEALLMWFRGGFPCTNISICGDASGLDGEASGLWVEQRRIINEVRPRLAYMENSPMLTSRGLGRILGDLAELGFDARWGVFSAYDAGLDHRRDRIWIVADANGFGRERQRSTGDRQKESRKVLAGCTPARALNPSGLAAWRAAQPGVQRMVDGLATAMDRHRAIGNGQVPRVAATAFYALSK